MRPTTWITRRLAREERGFTLVELLIVLIILGILTAIGLPSYLSFKDNGRKAAAAAHIKEAVLAINAYANDNYGRAPTSTDPDWNGTDAAGTGTNADNGFQNLTITALKAKYNPSLPTSYTWDPAGYTYSPDNVKDYCVYTVNGVWYAARKGSGTATTVGKTMRISDCTAY